MSTLRRSLKQGLNDPQKHKLAHVVRRAARSNRYWPEFPISTLPCMPNLMPAALWCQARGTMVSNLVRNVPFVTSLEVSPFLFWFLLFFSSLAWPGA